MKAPLFIRPLSADERLVLQTGLHSRDTFTRRRCQILLANAEGKTAPKIATQLGCATQTALNALNAFIGEGMDCLREKSHRTKSARPFLIQDKSAEQVFLLLNSNPNEFGRDTGLWTLSAVAEVAFEQGLTSRPVCEETIRQTFKRLGVDWMQAKNWGHPNFHDTRQANGLAG